MFADQVDKVVLAFAGETEYIVTEAKGSKVAEGGAPRKPEYRSRNNDAPRAERPAGGGGTRSYGGGGDDKPWRKKSYEGGSERSSSSSSRERRPATSGGTKRRW